MTRIIRIEPNRSRALRVAAYCRVSTGGEGQMDSFEQQKAYYSRLIESHSRWELAGIYGDAACSGTGSMGRPQFRRLLQDCRDGKIDLVLVKSISRFARNAADCQNYIREMKTLGVEIRFEENQISNMEPAADFIFSMLAVAAQEESRSISENVRWRYGRDFSRGVYRRGNNRILGYDMDGLGRLLPNDQAWMIRKIFEDYAAGMNFSETARDLNECGARRMRSLNGFTADYIRRILQNEVYAGDLRLQKAAPRDYLTKRPQKHLSYTSYYIENDHAPIIDRALWLRVKNRLDETAADRREGIYKNGGRSHFLYGILFCGECGEVLVRKTYKNRRGTYCAWKCRGRIRKNGCRNPAIRETVLFGQMVGRMEKTERIFVLRGRIEIDKKE